MIILAAAIILSLSNSGIISKANKAKTDSDTANLKEYVNTLRAEWELMTTAERETCGSATFEDYANKKLEANGYKGAVGVDGEIYSNLNENAMAAIKAGIKVGDTVTGYELDVATYTTSGEENTYDPDIFSETTPQPQTVTTNKDIIWKYLGVNANGEMEIMAVLSETDAITDTTDKQLKVKLGGKGGYLKGPGMLNTICEKLYSKEGVGTARSMNIDDVNSILGYTGEKGIYYDNNGKEVKTPTALRIGDIDSQLGTSLGTTTRTPDGRELATYYVDYYYINKTSTDITNSDDETKSLVYNAKNTYWLASPCVDADFNYSYSGAGFYVRYVSSTRVYAGFMSNSHDDTNCATFAVRPVVKLDPSVKLVKDATAANTWNISK